MLQSLPEYSYYSFIFSLVSREDFLVSVQFVLFENIQLQFLLVSEFVLVFLNFYCVQSMCQSLYLGKISTCKCLKVSDSQSRHLNQSLIRQAVIIFHLYAYFILVFPSSQIVPVSFSFFVFLVFILEIFFFPHLVLLFS